MQHGSAAAGAVLVEAPAGPQTADAVPAQRPSAATQLDAFVGRLARAFAQAGVSQRLVRAQVVVRVTLTDAPGTTLTFLLHRPPARVVVGSTGKCPDVRLAMTFENLVATFSDGSYLPMEILAGRITFEGPVRKFLRVLPSIRDAVATVPSST